MTRCKGSSSPDTAYTSGKLDTPELQTQVLRTSARRAPGSPERPAMQISISLFLSAGHKGSQCDPQAIGPVSPMDHGVDGISLASSLLLACLLGIWGLCLPLRLPCNPVTSVFHRPPCTIKPRTSARMEIQQLMLGQPRFFWQAGNSLMGRGPEGFHRARIT